MSTLTVAHRFYTADDFSLGAVDATGLVLLHAARRGTQHVCAAAAGGTARRQAVGAGHGPWCLTSCGIGAPSDGARSHLI
jgi:hypothetical protein